MTDVRKTIKGRAIAETVEKKSRFIAHIAHVETEKEALDFIEEVRATHRMARHNVYAYVLHAGGRVRYTDDGEPPKTAGIPTLEVIRHAGLSDVAVVVTRYFGGTLLGTGGLVRAYTRATQAAIEAGEILVISKCRDIALSLPYGLYDQVKYLCEHRGVKMGETAFTDTVAVTLHMLDEEYPTVERELRKLIRDDGSIGVGEAYEAPF